MKENKKQSEHGCPSEEADIEIVLGELKNAYRSINALKRTPAHWRITLDIERKIRAEQEKKDGKIKRA